MRLTPEHLDSTNPRTHLDIDYLGIAISKLDAGYLHKGDILCETIYLPLALTSAPAVTRIFPIVHTFQLLADFSIFSFELEVIQDGTD